MGSKIILQTAENGKIDILVKEPGFPADHYLRVTADELQEHLEGAGVNAPGTELVDLRK